TDAQVLASQGDIQAGSVTGSSVEINAGQGITLAGAESTSGDVDIAGSTISVGGAIASANDVNMTSTNEMNLASTVAAAGAIALDSDQGSVGVGGEISGGSVAINAEQGITLAGAESTSGDVDIAGSTISVGGAIASANDVNMTSTNEMDLASTVAADGAIALDSDQGTVSVAGDISGASVAILAPGTISLGGDVASGSSIEVTSAGGSVSSTGDLTAITDAQVLASQGDIQAGSVTGSSVEINAGQGITLAGAESTSGDVDIAGSTISADGAIASANDVNMTSTDAMNLAGPVDATGSIALGSDQGTVLVGAVHGQSVTLTAADDLTIQDGSVVGATVAINAGNLLSLSDGSIEVTAGDLKLDVVELTTAGETSLSASGNINIHDGINRSTISMSSGSLNMIAGNDLTLNAAIDGGGSLQATAGDQLLLGGNIGKDDALDSITLAAPRLVLGGDALSVDIIKATNDIALNSTNLSAMAHGLPSVYSFGNSLDITSNVGDISIGNYQGLSCLGDLSLTAGGQIAVGDVTTLGDLTIGADSIMLHRREAINLDGHSGLTPSAQTSLISGGVLRLSGAVASDGQGTAPRFAGVDGVSGVNPWQISRTDAFGAADMELSFDNKQRLALLPVGSTSPAPSNPDLVAEETHFGEVEFKRAAGDLDLRLVQTETAVLAEMGIQVVDGLERPSGNGRLSRAGLVENEMVATINGPDSGLVQVVRSRLSPQYVQRAVVTYADAISTGDSAGSLATAGSVLRDAQEQYAQQSTTAETQTTYRAWLASGDSPIQQQASKILASLDATFSDLYRAGLTKSEIAASRRYVAAQMNEGGEPVQLVAKIVQVHPAS
ncbi:MAG: hypothetical protein P8I91_08925, partial [Phycisphaerales bacterium]|nr:hypothetical protein [Phycisphaerales bacterium]